MIEFMLGLLGFVLSMGIFMLGFFLGRNLNQAETKPVVKSDDVEFEKAMKERERLEREQAAFRALTGYSADIAYGLAKFPEEDKE